MTRVPPAVEFEHVTGLGDRVAVGLEPSSPATPVRLVANVGEAALSLEEASRVADELVLAVRRYRREFSQSSGRACIDNPEKGKRRVERSAIVGTTRPSCDEPNESSPPFVADGGAGNPPYSPGSRSERAAAAGLSSDRDARASAPVAAVTRPGGALMPRSAARPHFYAGPHEIRAQVPTADTGTV